MCFLYRHLSHDDWSVPRSLLWTVAVMADSQDCSWPLPCSIWLFSIWRCWHTFQAATSAVRFFLLSLLGGFYAGTIEYHEHHLVITLIQVICKTKGLSQSSPFTSVLRQPNQSYIRNLKRCKRRNTSKRRTQTDTMLTHNKVYSSQLRFIYLWANAVPVSFYWCSIFHDVPSISYQLAQASTSVILYACKVSKLTFSCDSSLDSIF